MKECQSTAVTWGCLRPRTVTGLHFLGQGPALLGHLQLWLLRNCGCSAQLRSSLREAIEVGYNRNSIKRCVWSLKKTTLTPQVSPFPDYPKSFYHLSSLQSVLSTHMLIYNWTMDHDPLNSLCYWSQFFWSIANECQWSQHNPSVSCVAPSK